MKKFYAVNVNKQAMDKVVRVAFDLGWTRAQAAAKMIEIGFNSPEISGLMDARLAIIKKEIENRKRDENPTI